MELLSHRDRRLFNFKKVCAQWWGHFVLFSLKAQRIDYSTSSLCIANLFNFCHCGGWEILSCCFLICIPTMMTNDMSSFCVLIDHLGVSFCDVMCLFKYHALCYLFVLAIYFDCRSFAGYMHWFSSNLWLFFSPSLVIFSEHGFQFWYCLIHHFLILWLVIFVLYQKREREKKNLSLHQGHKNALLHLLLCACSLNSLFKVHGLSPFGVYDVR